MNGVGKYEAVGIFLSIMVMVGLLVLVRYGNPFSKEESAPTEPVVVNEEKPDEREALTDAIYRSAHGTEIEKLIIDDTQIGKGAEAKVGDTVTVHYIGQLLNGEEFDNSQTRGVPFSFTLGENKVISGWEQGVPGMKVGGKRILIIPSSLAYGDSGAGPIPGGATLVFAIELLAIE